MGFTIPNYETAVNTINGVGDQAEPDSVDFQVLGDKTCALIYDSSLTTNGQVTVSGTSYIISVAPFKAISLGTYLTKGTATSLTLTSGGANPRYDLVVIPSNGTPTVRVGTESAANPVFPTMTDGDVLLAAIYRPSGGAGSSEAVAGRIVDKRQFILSNTTWLKSASPTSGDGVNGDLWIDTTATATGQSMLWIKRSGTWENLAGYVPMSATNTASALVQRDGSGNFAANTITATSFSGPLTGNVTGNVSGNAGTATAWQTARTVTLSGVVAGTITLDGTSSPAVTTTFGATKVPNSQIDYTSVPAQFVQTDTPTGKAGDIWVKV